VAHWHYDRRLLIWAHYTDTADCTELHTVSVADLDSNGKTMQMQYSLLRAKSNELNYMYNESPVNL